MRLARHVVARKDQWLVALPAQLRARLGLTPGAMVWWHIGKKRQATLTVSGRVRAGRPAIDEDCPTCEKLRAELDRLRREVRDGESATPGQFWRQGYMRALGDVGNVKHDVELAVRLLKQLMARDRRAGPSPATRAARRARRATVRGVEVVKAPVLVASDGAPVEGDTSREHDSAEDQTDRS